MGARRTRHTASTAKTRAQTDDTGTTLGRRGTLSHTLSYTRLLQLLALEAGSVEVAPRQPRALEHGTFEPRPFESRAYDKSTSFTIHTRIHTDRHMWTSLPHTIIGAH